MKRVSTKPRTRRVHKKEKIDKAWSHSTLRLMAEDLERQANDRDENVSLEQLDKELRDLNFALRTAAGYIRSAYALLQQIPLIRYGQCRRCHRSKVAGGVLGGDFCECNGGPL